jgi:hypothetical protein
VDVTRVLAELRAEVERVTAERDRARAELAEATKPLVCRCGKCGGHLEGDAA